MPRLALTGSRIRERRIDLGIRQARLAEMCSISASYLNLIEHNRRSIGGKLLNSIAEALGVEAVQLAEGADATLIDALTEAAAGALDIGAETDRAEELAGRFPGWAQLLAVQSGRIQALERTVEVLNDRLSHDPQLAASLHEILTSASAIRSTSGILTGEDEVDPEWQVRFHRNLKEDSHRLAEAAQGLVAFLDQSKPAEDDTLAPSEALDRWLSARGYHFPELEGEVMTAPERLVGENLTSDSAADLARRHLIRYAADAQDIPLAPLAEVLETHGPDPKRVQDAFNVGLSQVLRRLATLPGGVMPDVGLAICDASGTMTFQRHLVGFSLPRFGSACPLLPLYQALSRPMHPVRAIVEPPGQDARRFLTYAVAEPAFPTPFEQPPVFEATMLVLPLSHGAGEPGSVPVPIGPTCRICVRDGCAARREPSILQVS